MKCRIVAISAGLLTFLNSTAVGQQAKYVHEYSYDLGMTVTTQVRQQLSQSGVMIDNEAFLRGVQDALEGKQSGDANELEPSVPEAEKVGADSVTQ